MPPRTLSLRRSRAARPERIRVSLFDDATSFTPVPLPSQRSRAAGIAVGAVFVVMATIAATQLRAIRGQSIDTVADLMAVLFQGFWVIGWSVGVIVLFLVALLFLFYSEYARLTRTTLIHVPRLGPLKVFLEYDLARIRDLKSQAAGAGRAEVRFTYRGRAMALGNPMPPPYAERAVELIQSAIAALGAEDPAASEPDPAAAAPSKSEPSPPTESVGGAQPVPWTSRTALALIAANLVPFGGVLLLGWDLGQIMTLFWAENAVIGFYTLIKLAIVGKWKTLLVGPFFVAHFGGFMAGHFLFIYFLFVRGVDASGPEPAVATAMANLFVPLWPALLAMLISHGVSFQSNFLARREWVRRDVGAIMNAPYKRIIIMHVTIIFGGWMILLLRSPLPALLLLIALKTFVDLRAHRNEHAT